MFFWLNINYTVPSGGGGKKPPKKGYKRGKVVVCPKCLNIAPYDPAMRGQELHCPKCDHRFYLGNNVKEAWIPPIVKCKKCGTLNGKDVKVCPVCGKTLFNKGGKSGRLVCENEGCGYERELKK